jgi:hypothetical protein
MEEMEGKQSIGFQTTALYDGGLGGYPSYLSPIADYSSKSSCLYRGLLAKISGRSQQERGMRITSTYLQYQLALNIEDCRLKCGDKKAGPLLPGMSESATISFHFENSPKNRQESFPFKLIYHFQAIIFVSKWSNHHPIPGFLGGYFSGKDLYYFSLQYWFIPIKSDEARVLKSSNMNLISMLRVLYD